jgi:hypothetical protein
MLANSLGAPNGNILIIIVVTTTAVLGLILVLSLGGHVGINIVGRGRGNVGESMARTRVAAEDDSLNLVIIFIVIIYIIVLLSGFIIVIVVALDNTSDQLTLGDLLMLDLGSLQSLDRSDSGLDKRLATNDLVDLGASHGDALSRGSIRHGGVRLCIGAASTASGGASRV